MTAFREDMRALVAAARTNAAADVRKGAHARDLLALLARAHNAASSACGLTQDELAEHMGVDRSRVARFGIPDQPGVPSAKHIARAPDEYVDAFMRELAAIRTERGSRPRQWLPAPEVQLVDDLQRANALIAAAANAQRAALLLQKPAASAGELKIVERELTEAAELALEAVQRVRERLREAGKR